MTAGTLPLVEPLPAGLTAWAACRRLAHLPHLLFLDSASVLPHLGRWSFVSAAPFAWLQARNRAVAWTWYGPAASPFPGPGGKKPLPQYLFIFRSTSMSG